MTIIAAALSATAALPLVSPAYADTVTAGDGAKAVVADTVSGGNAIHIEGTGWANPTGGGSTIGVKLQEALTTEPLAGPVTNPGTGTSADEFDIWAAVGANADGSFSADIPFPTPTNTKPALTSAWAVGTTHQLRLLTGALKSGDQPRSVLLTFKIGEGLVTTATTATNGQVTVTFSGGTFPAGEKLAVKQGAAARQWTVTSGRTSTVQDLLTVGDAGTISARVVLPSGSAPAGPVTLTITGDKGTSQNVTATASPSVAFDKGTALGATGTLTLGNLAPSAAISSIKLGDATLASNLTANDAGVATAAYTIPTSLSPITQPLVITQTAPSALTYTLTQAVYPDERASGDTRFDLSSSTETLYQGLYQSAYSAAANAVFATASDRGTGAAGSIYKLDPDTLAIKASKATVYDDFARAGAFGIGVDDAHGNVWVTNTGANSVAIYKQSDLSLVKQFPTGTISHARDVVYDPKTDLVFASSASEGSTATSSGYISVFEADDKDDDGTKYEKLTDIQTGTRDIFNPVSLSLDDGKLFSPSLGSNQVLSIDTAHVLDADYKPAFLTVDGINVGGRGASGIAYDAADNRLFIASQNSSEVVIADATTGATITEVATGRQALNVTFDKVHKLAYVANFGGTSVSVIDPDGRKVASLPIATANHISLDGKGNAYVVDKAAGNKVWKITSKIETIGGKDILPSAGANGSGNAATTPLSVTVTKGQPIHLSGTNFRTADKTSGSKIAVKPASLSAAPIIAEIQADDQGTWSADVPFPSDWEVGDSQHLRLLTGSLKAGDVGRSIAIKVHVEAVPAEHTDDPAPTTPVTQEPAPTTGGQTQTPQTQTTVVDPVLQDKIAKATKQVQTDQAAVTAAHKKVVSVTAKRAKAKSQLAKAKKAAKTGSAKSRAAARKKVTSLTKSIKSLDKQLKSLKAKETKAKKQLTQSQSTLAGLKK